MALTYILTKTTTVPTHRRLFQIARWAFMVWIGTNALVVIQALPSYHNGVLARFCTPIEAALNTAQVPLAVCGAYSLALGFVTLFLAFSISVFTFWKSSAQWQGLIGAVAPLAYICVAIRFAYDLGNAHPEFINGLWLLQIINISLSVIGLLTLPNGNFVPRWSKWGWVAFVVAVILATIGQPATVLDVISPPNVLYPFVPIVWGLGLLAQIWRYIRFATPQQRQQTKIIVFSVIISFVMPAQVVMPFSESLQGHLSTVPEQAFWLIPYFLILAIRFLLIAIIPISFAVAILRYRLWDIDLFINRTLVVVALTAVLGIFFIGLLLAVQQGALLLTGGEQSSIAIAVASLTVALLFNPLRVRLQTYIDRRLYPQHLARIDSIAQRVPSKVSTHTRQELLNQKSMRLQQATTKTLGNYRLLEPIGVGGMAEVYRAEHIVTTQIVALKTLLRNKLDHANYVERFEREVQVTMGLKHSNIVQFYDFGMLDDTYYVAMEYISGKDLAYYLHALKRLTLAQARPILREVAAALDYAHAQNLVHRDVKPSNVLLESKSNSGRRAIPRCAG